MLSNVLKIVRNLNVLCIMFVTFTLKETTEAAYFDGCDHTYDITPGYSYLESPNYPYYYPSGTSCRYKFNAPLDHYITVNCTIDLDKRPNGCSIERFYFTRDGDIYLRDSEQLCGYGTFIRKSLFRSVTLAYTSNGSYGRFRCSLQVQPQPCDCGWSVNTKISAGNETSVNEYPSMAFLKDKNSQLQPFYCAAVIISHRYLLTAAHCKRAQPNPAQIEAWVGRHNVQSTQDTRYAAAYNVINILIHPHYTLNPLNNDIALVVTRTNIEYSRGVGPICLPPTTYTANDLVYSFVDVIGWGSIFFAGPTSPTLQKVILLVIDNKACYEAFEKKEPIYSTQMCTSDASGKHKDSCQFDSGGPVILRHKRQYLVGIISYGKECGVKKNSIGINTRITPYLNWIYENTGPSICKVSM